jgi:hypothetical protein
MITPTPMSVISLLSEDEPSVNTDMLGRSGGLIFAYLKYYNETPTHLSLDKNAPIPRAVESVGRILSRPVLGGLHHHYVRI